MGGRGRAGPRRPTMGSMTPAAKPSAAHAWTRRAEKPDGKHGGPPAFRAERGAAWRGVCSPAESAPNKRSSQGLPTCACAQSSSPENLSSTLKTDFFFLSAKLFPPLCYLTLSYFMAAYGSELRGVIPGPAASASAGNLLDSQSLLSLRPSPLCKHFSSFAFSFYCISMR